MPFDRTSFLLTRWLNFENVLSALLSKKVYHLNLKELQTYARNNCFINDEKEFTTMVNFYHDLGIIIKHCNTVILSAEWLIDVFRQLITIPLFDETVRSGSKAFSCRLAPILSETFKTNCNYSTCYFSGTQCFQFVAGS